MAPERITVPPIGPTDALIAIVGEAGGADEEENGQPFWPAAPTGGMLMDLLAAAGYARGEVYLTNVVKLRPPHNNIDAYFANNALTDRGKAWQEYLFEELRQVSAPVVVAVGRVAMLALTGETRSIHDMRGSPLVVPEIGKVVIPTIHPSFLLHTGNFLGRYLIAADLRNACEIARAGGIDALPKRIMHVNPTFAHALGFLAKIAEKSADDAFAFDIETSGSEVTCISFSLNPLEGMSIPLGHFRLPEQRRLWAAIKNILETSPARKITQNGNYDTFFLSWYYGIHTDLSTLDDIMVAHNIMYPQLLAAKQSDAATGKSLAMLCSLWAWEPYYKDEADQSRAGGDFTRYQRYNCMDSLVTHHVQDRIWPMLRALGVRPYDPGFGWAYDFTMARFPAIKAIQTHGFGLDTRGIQAAREKLVGEIAALQQRLDEAALPTLQQHLDPMLVELQQLEAERAAVKAAKGDTKPLTTRITKLRTVLRQWCKAGPDGKPLEWQWTLPIAASDKGCQYFYEWRGEPAHMKLRKGGKAGKTRTASVDDDALAKLAKPTTKRDGLIEAQLIQQIRERDKIITTYIDGCKLMPDGKVRAAINPRGTWTGRYSSNKLFFTYGVQLQNVVPQIRAFFLPDKPEWE